MSVSNAHYEIYIQVKRVDPDCEEVGPEIICEGTMGPYWRQEEVEKFYNQMFDKFFDTIEKAELFIDKISRPIEDIEE